MESYSADSDVDPKRRRGKLDKTQNTAGPSGQRERGNAVQYDRSAASTARSCAPDQTSASGMNRKSKGLDKMVQALQCRHFLVDQVQAYLDFPG